MRSPTLDHTQTFNSLTHTLSLLAGSLPSAVAGCAVFGGVMGFYDHSGGLRGPAVAGVVRKPFFKEEPLVTRMKSEINELDKV